MEYDALLSGTGFQVRCRSAFFRSPLRRTCLLFFVMLTASMLFSCPAHADSVYVTLDTTNLTFNEDYFLPVQFTLHNDTAQTITYYLKYNHGDTFTNAVITYLSGDPTDTVSPVGGFSSSGALALAPYSSDKFGFLLDVIDFNPNRESDYDSAISQLTGSFAYNGGNQVSFGPVDVTVVDPIPEPSTLVLFSSGLLAVISHSLAERE